MTNQILISSLPLQYKGLTEDLIDKAEKELNEREYNKSEGLKNLRRFIQEENLPGKLDDETLLQFLRVAKFDFKKSRERLEKYCKMRGKREFVELFDEKKIMELIDGNIVGLLPYRCSNGTAIMYSIAGIFDSDLCTEKNLAACHRALAHYTLSFPATSVSGLRYIISAGTAFPRRTLTDITMYKNHANLMMCLPLRMKGVVVVEANALVRFCYGAIRHFLPYKVTSRMHIQKESGISMPDVFDPSILPTEFGGKMGPVSNEHFRDDFLRFLKKMKSEHSMFDVSDN